MKVSIKSKNGCKIVNLNRRKAINERCLNCSGWIPSEVTGCIITGCSLYSFRTGKGKQNPKKRRDAIRKYCLWCVNGQFSEVKKCVSHTCPLFPYRLREVDRSVEIAQDPEKDHIGLVSEDKKIKASQYVGS